MLLLLFGKIFVLQSKLCVLSLEMLLVRQRVLQLAVIIAEPSRLKCQADIKSLNDEISDYLSEREVGVRM